MQGSPLEARRLRGSVDQRKIPLVDRLTSWPVDKVYNREARRLRGSVDQKVVFGSQVSAVSIRRTACTVLDTKKTNIKIRLRFYQGNPALGLSNSHCTQRHVSHLWHIRPPSLYPNERNSNIRSQRWTQVRPV